MPFATRSDLLARANARRLAQLAVPADHPMPVSETALRSVIGGASLGSFPEDERASLVLALAAIDAALSDAGALLLSYGISPEVRTTLLARLASTVALYYLQGAERMTGEIKDAYEAVLKLLDLYRKGVVDLVPDIPGEAGGGLGGLAEIGSAPERYR
jgi:phage gp36-like protein